MKLVNINKKGNINVSRAPAVSNPKNVPYYYQCHRFSLTGAFLCLAGYLRSVLFGKSLEVDILGLCVLETENPTRAGIGFGDRGLQADFLAECGSLELTAMLRHNSGSCP